MEFRCSQSTEIDRCWEIIQEARQYLKDQGIDQWQTGYPDRDCLERDVRTGKGYFLEEDGIPLGYLCVDFDGEPAYDHLNGTWAREEPYVVVHRLALSDAARGRGAAGTAFQLVEDLCRDRGGREFRVDRDAGNHKMQHILAKQGFQYRGTIRFDNSEKIAYEKLL